jgi:TolB-like protein
MNKSFHSLKTLFSISIFTLLFFQGCNQNTIVIPKNDENTPNQKLLYTLDSSIKDIRNQLINNNKIDKKDTGTITITSFVDLNQFNKTSELGRIISESLFHELFSYGNFNLTDFRGQNEITINNNGEFYLTRNITKLQSETSNTYVIVGTYLKFEDNIVLNARILDNKTGKIVSSAKSIYRNEDCRILNSCNNVLRKIKLVSDSVKEEENKTTQEEKTTNKIIF